MTAWKMAATRARKLAAHSFPPRPPGYVLPRSCAQDRLRPGELLASAAGSLKGVAVGFTECVSVAWRRARTQGDGAGRSAQRACERSNDWPRGAEPPAPDLLNTTRSSQLHSAVVAPSLQYNR